MSYTENLRGWCKDHGKLLHERVLPDGQHHVWVSLWPGFRVDAVARNFEHACWRAYIHILACYGEPRAQATYRKRIMKLAQ